MSGRWLEVIEGGKRHELVSLRAIGSTRAEMARGAKHTTDRHGAELREIHNRVRRGMRAVALRDYVRDVRELAGDIEREVNVECRRPAHVRGAIGDRGAESRRGVVTRTTAASATNAGGAGRNLMNGS